MTSATIAVPAWRQIEVMTCLGLLEAHALGYGILFQWNDALVQRSRARLVTRFLKEYPEADTMVFIDSDIIFTGEQVTQLVEKSREKGTVVGIPVALRERGRTNVTPLPGETVRFGPGRVPVGVKAIGTAFMAIPRPVLVALTEKHGLCNEGIDTIPFSPIFEPIVQEDGVYHAEDHSFCERVKDAGFSIWALPDIQVGHIGTQEFHISQQDTAQGAGAGQE